MRVLVAESNLTGRNQLTRMLELDGHEVLQADTWKELLAQFSEFQPNLVLLEPALSDMVGGCCAAEIKRLSPDRFVPVILVTTISCNITLAHFLGSGADDFIEPPYNHLVLKAKIAGFERMDELYRRLEKFRDRTQQELHLAKHMFDTITKQKPENIPYIDHWSLAAGHFSGDLLIFERTPDNALHIMLGDFTGHGLAAAIGALPTSDTFFTMTKKGFGIGDIAAEINSKLHRLMPTGQFCAASLISIAPQQNRIEVWNGGLPSILLVNAKREVIHQLCSDKLPLGILDAESFSSQTATVTTENVCHAILYSDGLVEAENAHGHAFGDHGLSRALGAECRSCSLIQNIKAEVIDFLGGLEPHDDISLLTVNMETLS
ncbi:MAG: SpoIIE family protein phosphatase [Gallionella sp.]|nr:SpoIIE family protein phosphatase [Gallionella sp.]